MNRSALYNKTEVDEILKYKTEYAKENRLNLGLIKNRKITFLDIKLG